MQTLLTESEAASWLSIAPATLRRWRVEGKGPPFTKIGRAVRYPHDKLFDYIEERLRPSTSHPGGRHR